VHFDNNSQLKKKPTDGSTGTEIYVGDIELYLII
jgi:hypothetical protein